MNVNVVVNLAKKKIVQTALAKIANAKIANVLKINYHLYQ
jgi:hypothetical protein